MATVVEPPRRPGPCLDDMGPAIVDRVTKSGRRLFYKLTVIQQPERARACGSGPKSSADRRPVDPPPVVELRIFEGPTWKEAERHDITFQYNANFFLFATLEHARLMANGRLQTPNQPPVLTGMPVSGMAYLDRPIEAGYFLFPDLSVRHEGHYRLNFNLYEETKDEADRDPETAESANPGIPLMPGSFDFRMEVKSCTFHVYSAKKFPGLNESTQLSRVVAEQGCRVRIRRDVRMRRRDGKAAAAATTADHKAEDDRVRAARSDSPDMPPHHRARSMSGSVDSNPYAADMQRRPSGPDYPSHGPPHAPPPGGHLHFLGTAGPQYPAQPHAYPPPPPSPSHHAYPQHPSYYNHQPSPPPLAPSYRDAHMPDRPPSALSRIAAAPAAPMDSPIRRSSIRRPPSMELQPRNAELDPVVNKLPPLLAAAPANYGSPDSVELPSLTSPAACSSFSDRPSSYCSTAPAVNTPSSSTMMAGSKRSRDETFDNDDDVRYHDGAREEPKYTPFLEIVLTYRRADGFSVSRKPTDVL